MSLNHSPLQNPVVRRFSQVYVEIPPSPLHRSRTISGTPVAQHVFSLSANLKENAPLRASNMIQGQTRSTSASPSRKRKLSESDTNMGVAAVPSSSTKKAKLVTDADKPKVMKPSKAGAIVQKTLPSNATEEFPNGFFYCHQCSKKRDSTSGIHCTLRDAHNNRCKVKFCTPCLKNRYGERVDEIKGARKMQDDPAHVQHEDYLWKCPKCRDICNCARCRKAKGLEPTGNLTIAARRTGADSAAVMLSANPATIGILPGKGQQITPMEKKPKIRKPQEPAQASTSAVSTSNANKLTTKGKRGVTAGTSTKLKPKPKTLPTLKWSKVPLDGSLTLAEAESRMHIREFVLRFASIMDCKSLTRKMLEELEEIGGDDSRGRGCGWDNDDKEDEEVLTWVSEMCAKGVVMGLLGLIHSDEGLKERKLIGDAIKELRASGANLTKVWAILASLRESVRQSSDLSNAADSLSSLPDPLPAPFSATYHNTRTTRTANANPNAVLVTQSSQMVPVLVALIEAALETEVLRGEIEEGVKEGKDKVREGREGTKNENERWDKEKENVKAKAKEAKQKRDAHKRTVLDLDESLKVAMSAYIPRFNGPLGKDMDGRLYWALSPGVAERENAMEMIAQSVGGDTKGKRYKRVVPDDGDRKGMKKWSWFVGVWGKSSVPSGGKTEKTMTKKDKSDSQSVSNEEDQDSWWGFWEPAEIRKVADWIEIRGGLEDDAQSSKEVVQTEINADGQEEDAFSRASSPLSAMSDTEDPGMDMYAKTSSKAELKALVKGLKEFASLLEWRIRKDFNDMAAKPNGSGSGVMAASKFDN